MIDHPQTMWGIIQQHGAKPAHHGAEKMFTVFAAGDGEKNTSGLAEGKVYPSQ